MKENRDEKINQQIDKAITEANQKHDEDRKAGTNASGTEFDQGARMGFDLGRAQGIKEALNFLRSESMSLSQVFTDAIEKRLLSKPEAPFGRILGHEE